MNRHERRRRMDRENKFYHNYVAHLPSVPLDAPLERGRVYHLVMTHDPWCAIYDKEHGTEFDCNCNPVITRHLEPQRS